MYLALAAVHVAPLQRDQRQKRAHEPGRGVGQAEGGQDRRLIGKAVDVGKTAIRLGQGAEARARGVGPVWPKPVIRNMISLGLIAESTSQPRPHRSSVPA